MTMRGTFSSRFGTLMTMIGVAVGLGNVWRFPYMVGTYGGAPFVLVYVLAAAGIGVPALMAEWTLGRATRRGPIGAFEKAGVPGGRMIGRVFFLIVAAAIAYYTNAVGWVLFHAVTEVAAAVGIGIDAAAILPPESGFDRTSFLLQLACTGAVAFGSAVVLAKGLGRGAERISKVVMPLLLMILLVMIVRSVTLDGAMEGLRWYAWKFDPSALTGSVMLAALGQAVFSLSLGGTYMVVYGSYLSDETSILSNAAWTAVGDVTAGLLAGFAIFPAVFALGMEPASGPGLLFSTLPGVFASIPGGAFFGLMFFAGLAAAAWLSDLAAFEVLISGLTDTLGGSRKRAVYGCAGLIFLLAIPTMINMEIFVPWDLTFGSGVQTAGALLAVLTVGWSLDRGRVLEELSRGRDAPVPRWLVLWIRYVIPLAILLVGIWWVLTDLLGVVAA